MWRHTLAYIKTIHSEPKLGSYTRTNNWGGHKKNIEGWRCISILLRFEFGGYFLARFFCFFFSDLLNCIFCHLLLPLSGRPVLEGSAVSAELFSPEKIAISTSSAKSGLETSVDDHTRGRGLEQTEVARCDPSQDGHHHHHHQYQWGAGRSTYKQRGQPHIIS